MIEQHELDAIIEANPSIDRTAIERSREAVKQLADVGIKLGGYRLKPALGGATVEHSGGSTEQGSYSMHQQLRNQG